MASASLQGGYFQIRDRRHLGSLINFFCRADGRFSVNPDNGGNAGFLFEPLRWYRIEFRNINWVTRTFDYAVDGFLLKAGIPLQGGGTAMNRLFIGNSDPGAEAWWDEIIAARSGTGWLRGNPPGASVPPGQSTGIDFTLDATGLAPGVYTADVLFATNITAQAPTPVLATLTVQALPNNPPVATGSTITAVEDTPAEFVLTATDPDGNALLTRITTVPSASQGILYQVLSDGGAGAQIAAGDVLIHPARKLRYVPPADAFGNASASFKFKVNDGTVESAEATVTINLTPVNDAPVARNDTAHSPGSGAITNIQVLANDTDPDGDSLTVTAVGAAGRGTATLSAGQINYTPAAGFVDGTDSFTYTVEDTAATSATAVVVVKLGRASGGDWTTLGVDAQRSGYYQSLLGPDPLVEAWTRQIPANASQPVIAGGRVIFSQERGFLTSGGLSGSRPVVRAMELSSGADMWEWLEPDTIYQAINPVSWADGRILFLSGKYTTTRIRSLRNDNGSQVWASAVGNQNSNFPAPAASGAGIWFNAGVDGGLYGFNPGGTQMFFNPSLPPQNGWAPAVGTDGTVYTCISGTLRAHHPSTGAVQWSTVLNPSGSSATPCISGGGVFVISGSVLYAVDLNTHAILWQIPAASGIGYYGLPAAAGGIVFAQRGVNVESFDATTGTAGLTYLSGQSASFSPGTLHPVILDDAVIVSFPPYFLGGPEATVIFNRATGSIRQSLPAGGFLSVSAGFLVVAGTNPFSNTQGPNIRTIRAWRSGSFLNPPPSAVAQSITLGENGQAAVTPAGTDPQGEYVFPVITMLPAKGSLYQTPDGITRGTKIAAAPAVSTHPLGTILYVPGPDGSGSPYETWTFKMSDGYSLSSEATVTVNVAPVPDPPMPFDDIVFVQAGHPALIQPLLNDRDPDGDTLTLAGFDNPSRGSAVAEGPAGIRYSPDPDVLSGTDEFHYTVSDGTGRSVQARIIVKLVRFAGSEWNMYGNDAGHTGHAPAVLGPGALTQQWSATIGTAFGPIASPVCVADGLAVVSAWVGQRMVKALEVTTGAEVWRQTFSGLTDVEKINPPAFIDGRVYLQMNRSSQNHLWALDGLTGTPVWSAPYSDQSFTHYAPTVDGDRVWINGGSGGGLYGFQTAIGSQLFFRQLPQVVGWTPCYADGFVYSFVNGTLIAHDPSAGVPLRTMQVAETGSPVFTVAGGHAFLNTGSLVCVQLDTLAVNWTAGGFEFAGHPAVAAGVVYVMSYTGHVRAYDVQTGVLLRTFATNDVWLQFQPVVTHDTLIVASDSRTYLFDLASGALRQTIAAGGLLSFGAGRLFIAGNTGTLRAYGNLPPDNAAPLAKAVSAAMLEDSQITLQLEGTDNDGDPLIAVVKSLPSAGRLYQTTDGITRGDQITAVNTLVSHPLSEVIFVPDSDRHGGPYSAFSFSISDSRIASAEATVSLHVTPVNDPPQARADEFTLVPGQLASPLPLLANDVDPDGSGDLLTIQSFTQGASGEVVRLPSGSLAYIPRTGSPLTDSFTYTLTDTAGRTSTASVSLTATTAAGDWPALGGGPEHRSHSPRLMGAGPLSQAWSRTYPENSQSIKGYAVAGGKVFLTRTNVVDCLDAVTGAVIWSGGEIGGGSEMTPPTIHGGQIIFRRRVDSNDSHMYALNASNGTLVWRKVFQENAQEHRMAPVVTDNGIWVNNGSELLGFSRSGSPRYHTYVGSSDRWESGVGSDGNVYSWVFGQLTAYHPTTGIVQWFHQTGAAADNLTTPVLTGNLAVAAGATRLVCFDLSAHALKWSVNQSFTGIPAVSPGRVYALQGSKVLSFDLETGDALGQYECGQSLANQWISQPVITADRLFASSSTNTHVFDIVSRVKLQTLTGGGALAVSGGTLFAHYGDTLRAFNTSQSLTFTPDGGTTSGAIIVTLTASDPAAKIHYSTDPLRPPGLDSPWVASGGTVSLSASVTLAAVAVSGENAGLTRSSVFTITDSDTDGLPDWWELQHFPALTIASRDADSDRDGWRDLDEFLFGTAPHVASAQPSIALEFPSGAPRLTWSAAPGRSYRVQGSDDLQQWTAVSPDLRTAGNSLGYTLSPRTRRFLRVDAFP